MMQDGWYRTKDGANWLLYSHYNGQWHAHGVNGEVTACGFEYIDQAGPIELIAGYPA
jgi:hypothetical protein